MLTGLPHLIKAFFKRLPVSAGDVMFADHLPPAQNNALIMLPRYQLFPCAYGSRSRTVREMRAYHHDKSKFHL